jgi:hypothetical protein
VRLWTRCLQRTIRRPLKSNCSVRETRTKRYSYLISPANAVDVDAVAVVGCFVCFHCGKSGHTAGHSRAAKSSEHNSVRHCNVCGKNGHLESTCWSKPVNEVPERAMKWLQDEINELRASSVAQTNKNRNNQKTILCSCDC